MAKDSPFVEKTLHVRMRKHDRKYYQLYVRALDGTEIKLLAYEVENFKDTEDTKSEDKF